MVLPRFYATAVDCAHEVIKGESRIKGKLAKFSKINKRGVLNRFGRVAKNEKINKQGVPFIRNSRAYQEQIQSLKEACRTKGAMISKLLDTLKT